MADRARRIDDLCYTGDDAQEETATAPEDLAVPWVDPQGQSPSVAGLFQTAAVELSRDGGKTFEERATPDPLVDLEADPDDTSRLVASTQQSVIGSADEGKTWRELDRIPNVRFTWPEPDVLYRIDPGGPVEFSPDGGRTWEARGTTGGEPQAMFADSAGDQRGRLAARSVARKA